MWGICCCESEPQSAHVVVVASSDTQVIPLRDQEPECSEVESYDHAVSQEAESQAVSNELPTLKSEEAPIAVGSSQEQSGEASLAASSKPGGELPPAEPSVTVGAPCLWTTHTSLPALEARWEKMLAALATEPRNAQNIAVKSESEAYDAPIQWDAEGTNDFCKEMKRITRSDLVRFLLASNGNVEVAAKLAKSVAEWNAAVHPKLVTLPQISRAVSQELWRFGGWSKCGYPIVLAGSKGWRPGDYYSVDEYVRFVGYVMEVIWQSRMGVGVEKWILIAEFEGFSAQHVRPIAMKCLLQLSFVIQEMHVERMCFVGMTNTGPLRYFWPILRPFVKPRIGPVMHWPDSSDQRTLLTTFIDASILEKRFGGDFEGRYRPFTGRWEEDLSCEPPPAYNAKAPDPSPESYRLWYNGKA